MCLFFTESNRSHVADNGIDLAPARRSATTILDNMFKRIATGKVIDTIITKMQCGCCRKT